MRNTRYCCVQECCIPRGTPASCCKTWGTLSTPAWRRPAKLLWPAWTLGSCRRSGAAKSQRLWLGSRSTRGRYVSVRLPMPGPRTRELGTCARLGCDPSPRASLVALSPSPPSLHPLRWVCRGVKTPQGTPPHATSPCPATAARLRAPGPHTPTDGEQHCRGPA